MAEIAALEAETEARCAEITAEAEAKAAEAYEKRIAKGKADCAERGERLGAAADMEARKAILAFKQEMVGEAFEKATEAIINLPKEEYIDFLASQAAAASSSGCEELLFSERDKAVAQAAAEKANAILREKGSPAQLKVSEITADIPGGLILRQGDIEVNCAVDSLVFLHRDRLASQVASILFK